MARPTIPVKLIRGAMTKEKRNSRQQAEEKLRGAAYVPELPDYFTPAEVAAYKWITEALEPAGILGEPDRITVKLMATTIARLEAIDQRIREDPTLLIDKEVNRIRNTYAAQYFQLCKELCLTPASRSKVGARVTDKQSEDPLLKVLRDK